jgi:hypothetical protein
VHRQTFLVRLQQVAWGALAALALGCSTAGDDYPAPSTGDGGLPGRTIPDAAGDGAGDLHGDGGAGDGRYGSTDGGPADAPSQTRLTLEIDSPTKDEVRVAASRFTPGVRVTIDSTNATVSDTVTDVTATVKRAGVASPVASAKLAVTGLEQVPESAIAVHRFSDTPVDISKLESGNYEIEITVSTSSGLTKSLAVLFRIDAGPVIRIESPSDNGYYRDSATIDVVVTDTLFPLESVIMLLGGRELTVSGPSPSGQYTGTIQFDTFDPPLSGEQLLTVRATNQARTETVSRRRFVSDDRGPTITSTIPEIGDLIGRVIEISARVADPAGVFESSVVAVIAHGDSMFVVRLDPSPAGSSKPPGTYEALFDTARLPAKAIFPSISFRASDNPGNESSVGYEVSLDNTPPLADLHPPENFYLVKKTGEDDFCSHPFDPLGDDAVDDLQNVRQVFDIRARIEDQGNAPEGGADFVPIAGVDDTEVHLLILDDPSKALVVDTNGDGVCDSVNPLLTPTTRPMSSSDALLMNMVPVPPAGEADYTPQPLPLPGHAPCLNGEQTALPDPLCPTTNLTQAIPYAASNLAAIYTIAPVRSDNLQCVGRQFDALGNFVQDGWVCLAVAVSDSLGNLQVSRPLRVCLDKDGEGDECGVGRPAPPTCTGTQTASKPDVVIDSTPCRPWRAFEEEEFRRAP